MAKTKAKQRYTLKGKVATSAAPKEPTSEEKVLAAARKDLKACIDAESDLRAEMSDDLRFATLDQWPSDIRQERENDVENGPRPCLTIDKYSQYRTQVVNDMRQGKPGINVRPQDDSADIETAKVLKGLIRNIEDQSSADIAYSTAGGSAVDIGVGYFRITTEYVSDDSFDQEIFIRPIPNTFSVYLGGHLMPDGSDAELGYIVEAMPDEKFKAEYPKAKVDAKEFDGIDSDMVSYWKTEKTITVVEEYRIEKTVRELVYLADGTTITAEDYAAWPEQAGPRPTEQDRRTFIERKLKWRKMTAVEVLDSRDLPGKYIPIVEVIGREAFVNGKRVLWGLVRPAKDSLRMYNYWSSTITEKMALAPKTPYIGAVGQFATQQEKWKKANRINFANLEYDPVDVNGSPLPPPARQGPTPMEAALLKQMQVIEHDVQTSLGMFKAAVGESESQQSGRAILALQRESDTSTYHFGANLGVSIRHAGRIIVDLIPHYYDTRRIVRILGEDGDVRPALLDPSHQGPYMPVKGRPYAGVFNPGLGKYDVSITVGPSYNTKRMEAAATFVELAKGATDPMSAAIMRYLTVKNMDSEGAADAAKMLRALLPAPALQALDSGQTMPPQAQAALQQMHVRMQAMQQTGQELAQELQQAKSGQQAKMVQIQADHDAKMRQLELDRLVEAEKAKLAREKATADFELRKWIAEQEAGLNNAVAADEVRLAAGKLELDKQVHADKTAAEAADKAAADSTQIVPHIMKGMEGVVQQFADLHKGLLDHLKNPPQRTIEVAGIQRGKDGRISGAKGTLQ